MPKVFMRIVRDSTGAIVATRPDVVFEDGRRSSSWEDFHAARREQRPELYGALQ